MTAESGSCAPNRGARVEKGTAVADPRDSARGIYAAARRFCFTSVEVERLPFARAPLLRFGLSD